jgi:hypothetical protein
MKDILLKGFRAVPVIFVFMMLFPGRVKGDDWGNTGSLNSARAIFRWFEG